MSLFRLILFTMKTRFFTLLYILFAIAPVLGQNTVSYKMPLIGDKAPSFEAKSTHGDIKFPGDYYMKWKIIFSHPADFTPVCTSEILELAANQNDFKKLNTAVLVISTDNLNSHIDWIHSIESIDYKGRGFTKINFPIIPDPSLKISKLYGMIHPNSGSLNTIRAVFIISPDNRISAIFYYPKNVGRNFEEIKRTLVALQLSDKKDVLIPANWNPGGDVLIPSPNSMEEAEKLKKKKDPSLYSLAWYMWFLKL